MARARAWVAHGFTASGAVLGLAALIAIGEQQWRLALFWMAVSMAVDAADGTLARWAQVQRVLPGFDGALLDNIVDYLSYVIVPAYLILQAALLPTGAWGIAGAGAIALASAYQFCRTDAKTADHFFTGFPSYWNVLAFYLLLLRPHPWVNLAIVGVLCILVFVPFRYVYPSRTVAFRPLTVGLTAAWGSVCLLLLFQYPHPSQTLVWASLLYVIYYVGISLVAQRPEPARP